MSYYTISAEQRIENDRQAREDASKARGKGHVFVHSAQDVAHARFMRDMGL